MFIVTDLASLNRQMFLFLSTINGAHCGRSLAELDSLHAGGCCHIQRKCTTQRLHNAMFYCWKYREMPGKLLFALFQA